MAVRFPIRRNRLFAPILPLFGATAGRRYLEVTDDGLVARLGWLVHHRFALDEIKEATLVSGPSAHGPGWRLGDRSLDHGEPTSRGLSLFRASYSVPLYENGVISFVWSQESVVEIRFKRAQRVRVVLPRLRCELLAASLQDPERFLEALATTSAGITHPETPELPP
jgi:hypothetical protein